ncbi:transmembrane protein 223 [Bradysia coprophila]|uniref:transmembrane protein 223 n=1 Tax=Bradysia coprophila TaxID=38358 RepID=UPI00187DD986|nr:transmembrane protein 223 [Bradysia coprophila]
MNRLLFSLPQSLLNRSLPTHVVKHLQPFVIKPINYKLGSQLLHTSKILKYCSKSINSTGGASSSPLDGSAKLAKDVIVFKYENPNFFKYLNIFAICQYLCWNYLSYFSFTSLRDAPVDNTGEDVSWWRKINLGENKYRNTLTIVCFLIGYGILAISWLYTLRSVRFLILRKDGTTLSLVTYGPFGRNRVMNVPLRYVSAQQSRSQSKVQLPLKVKDQLFYYVLDMRGEFLNQRLYDFTVGLKRRF